MSEETTQVSPTETEAVEQRTESTATETTDNIIYAGKYKTVSELEKAYGELQSSYSKKLGAFEGAPEAYTAPEGFEDDAAYGFISKWGKDNNLSQSGLENLVTQYREYNQAALDQARTDYMKAETEKLGKDADYRIKNATDWVNANLGQDFAENINDMFPGAKGIEAIEKLMKVTTAQQPTQASPARTMDFDSIKAMRFAKDEFGNRRMSVDPAYRKRVEALEAEYYSNK